VKKTDSGRYLLDKVIENLYYSSKELAIRDANADAIANL